MSATYAGAKGKFAAVTVAAAVKLPLPALSEAERVRVAESKAFVEARMPEVVGVVKDLYGAGLIDGWRSVASVRLIERDGDGTR